MGKVVFLDPIDHICGKIAKAFRTIYNYRKASKVKYTSVRGPRTTQPSVDELELRNKFRIIRALVETRATNLSTLTRDQEAFAAQHKASGKYTTFRGWLMGKAYENWNEQTNTVDWPNSWDE